MNVTKFGKETICS